MEAASQCGFNYVNDKSENESWFDTGLSVKEKINLQCWSSDKAKAGKKGSPGFQEAKTYPPSEVAKRKIESEFVSVASTTFMAGFEEQGKDEDKHGEIVVEKASTTVKVAKVQLGGEGVITGSKVKLDEGFDVEDLEVELDDELFHFLPWRAKIAALKERVSRRKIRQDPGSKDAKDKRRQNRKGFEH